MHTRLAASVFAATVLVAARAKAEEQPSEFTLRRNAVIASVGPFGSPTGPVGITLERTVFWRLAVDVGAGLGGAGPQVAGGVVLRALEGDHWAFGPVASASYGKFKFFCLEGMLCNRAVGRVLWGSLGMADDGRFPGGVTVRFAVGASVDLACGGPECTPTYGSAPPLGERLYLLPYTTVGIGYAR